MQDGLGYSWAQGQLEPGTIWCFSISLITDQQKMWYSPYGHPLKLPDLTCSFYWYHQAGTGSLLVSSEKSWVYWVRLPLLNQSECQEDVSQGIDHMIPETGKYYERIATLRRVHDSLFLDFLFKVLPISSIYRINFLKNYFCENIILKLE